MADALTYRRANASSSALLLLLVAVGGLFDVQPVLPRGAGAVLRVRRRSFPLRLGRHRSGAGRAVLDLAGPAAHLPRVSARRPAATRRSACSAATATRCPSACRRSPSAFHASASTARCAMRPASARAPDDVPTIYPAAASHQTGEQEYLRFLFACASDPRFTADTILGEIAKNTRLSFIDRLLYRFAIIPGTRRGIAAARRRRRLDGRAGPTGAAAASIRSTRSSSASCGSPSTRPSATRT